MAKRYDPNDYLYASARIRAMELRLTPAERWNQLLETRTAEDALTAFSEQGDTARPDPETLSEQAMREALAAIAASVPDPTLTHFIRYPYDCNNLKVLEKCRIKGTPPDELFIDLGTVSVRSLQTVSENELLQLLPKHMAAALPMARDAFARTADPREIDFILDRAAFADMAEAAAPYPFAARLVAVRADLTNLTMCLRLLRMKSGAVGRAVLEHALLTVGTLSDKELLDCYDGGEDAFFDAISKTPYANVYDRSASLSVVEKRADDYVMDIVRGARSVTFGAEIPIAYLLAIETEGKNLRILLAGKAAGQDRDTIKAKLRKNYV